MTCERAAALTTPSLSTRQKWEWYHGQECLRLLRQRCALEDVAVVVVVVVFVAAVVMIRECPRETMVGLGSLLKL